MKKSLFVPLAVAGLLVLSAARSGASTLAENFAADPLPNGWRVFGDTNLFQWDATNRNLAVTWDSSQPNSYFYHPLGRTLTTNDSFCVLFELQLNDAIAFNSGAELAVGLLNFSEATNANFSRAFGDSPDLCEFDYFPAYVSAGQPYPASVDATLIDTASVFYFAYDNLTLNPGVICQVLLVHPAGAETISGEVFTNGTLASSMPNVYSGSPGAFRFDTLSVSSYADDGFGDSVLAHGRVGKLALASPLPVGLIISPAAGQVQFASDTNWLYTLEQVRGFPNVDARRARQLWKRDAPRAASHEPVHGQGFLPRSRRSAMNEAIVAAGVRRL